jgi:hypothetical protein
VEAHTVQPPTSQAATARYAAGGFQPGIVYWTVAPITPDDLLNALGGSILFTPDRNYMQGDRLVTMQLQVDCLGIVETIAPDGSHSPVIWLVDSSTVDPAQIPAALRFEGLITGMAAGTQYAAPLQTPFSVIGIAYFYPADNARPGGCHDIRIQTVPPQPSRTSSTYEGTDITELLKLLP